MVKCRHCRDKAVPRSQASLKLKHLHQCPDFQRHLDELRGENSKELAEVPLELVNGIQPGTGATNHGNNSQQQAQPPQPPQITLNTSSGPMNLHLSPPTPAEIAALVNKIKQHAFENLSHRLTERQMHDICPRWDATLQIRVRAILDAAMALLPPTPMLMPHWWDLARQRAKAFEECCDMLIVNGKIMDAMLDRQLREGDETEEVEWEGCKETTETNNERTPRARAQARNRRVRKAAVRKGKKEALTHRCWQGDDGTDDEEDMSQYRGPQMVWAEKMKVKLEVKQELDDQGIKLKKEEQETDVKMEDVGLQTKKEERETDIEMGDDKLQAKQEPMMDGHPCYKSEGSD